MSEKGRRIFVAEQSINLNASEGTNSVYVLELPAQALGATGGRVGGVGERRIQKLFRFRQENGKWLKVFETEDTGKLEKYDLPYHAAGLAVILPDGTERIVSGVVDEEYTKAYDETV